MIFTTTSLHHTTLSLICIRFTCPRCYSEGQEDRLAGGTETNHGKQNSTLLPPPPPPRWAPLTHRLNSHTRAGHFWGLCANYTGHLLNTGSCDARSAVRFGGEGVCARVTSHTHTTACVTLCNDERPDLGRLSFSGRPSVWHYTDWDGRKITTSLLLSTDSSWHIQILPIAFFVIKLLVGENSGKL